MVIPAWRGLSGAYNKDGGLKKSGQTPMVAKNILAGVFYPAEEYHQDDYPKNPTH
jgi:peptide methionine sulfoxide reductase MsrA